jgi:hypothetical protein|uniref:Uncharacterized protein n=1 Tax=viral metagenome TaxID=1070528 RepID=A0A6C0JP44_9ZZZZ|tara:strand:- start:19289 stop:19714 length:426 start_codon:yes stop_codon:yes gene_type:complete
MINNNLNVNNSKIKSPAYYGKIAANYSVGTEDLGFDGLTWCVIIKNNKYVWVRKTEDFNIMNNEINNTIISNNNLVKNDKNLKKKKKYTTYNEFLDIKMKELKETNLNLSPKDLFSQAVKEWHLIKKNVDELNNYLNKKND